MAKINISVHDDDKSTRKRVASTGKGKAGCVGLAFVIVAICLILGMCGRACVSGSTPKESGTTPKEKEDSPYVNLEDLELSEDVAKFVDAYNGISKSPITEMERLQTSSEEYRFISHNLGCRLFNSKRNLAIDIDSDKAFDEIENELWSVYHDAVKALDDSITEDDIESTWRIALRGSTKTTTIRIGENIDITYRPHSSSTQMYIDKFHK